MKLIRTPDENYFKNGYVKFSTSRKDGELYYKITLYNNKNQLYCAENGKVKDEKHLKELQEMVMIKTKQTELINTNLNKKISMTSMEKEIEN